MRKDTKPSKGLLKSILVGKTTTIEFITPDTADFVHLAEFEGKLYHFDDVIREKLSFSTYQDAKQWREENDHIPGMIQSSNEGHFITTGKRHLKVGAKPVDEKSIKNGLSITIKYPSMVPPTKRQA